MAGNQIVFRKTVNLESITQLAAQGMSRRGIARALHFHRELFDTRVDVRTAAETGEAMLEAEIVGRLMDKVRNGDLIATIYASKALCGFSETVKRETETPVESVKVYLPSNTRD